MDVPIVSFRVWDMIPQTRSRLYRPALKPSSSPRFLPTLPGLLDFASIPDPSLSTDTETPPPSLYTQSVKHVQYITLSNSK